MKKQIENIFSKTKEVVVSCPNHEIQIIVDTREKQSLILANLREQKANCKLEKLEIGDYLVGDLIIERKTFSDFVSSMINKRLQTQLIEMKKYPKQLLILEGFNYNYSKFKVHENAIRGMILSTEIDFHIPIFYTENEKETSIILILLAKKQKKDFSSRPNKTAKTLEEQKQFILEGFPNIGPVKAKQLLENFKNLKEIFNDNKKISKIIDEKTLEEFKRILEE